jgi:hypothetical protein
MAGEMARRPGEVRRDGTKSAVAMQRRIAMLGNGPSSGKIVS